MTTDATNVPANAPNQPAAARQITIPGTSLVGKDPYRVEPLAGTGCFAHPVMSELADASVQNYREPMLALADAFHGATRRPISGARLRFGLGLFGGSVAPKLYTSPDAEVSLNIRIDFHAKQRSGEDARLVVTEALVSIVRDVIKHARAPESQRHGRLAFVSLRSEWNNSLVEPHKRPAGLATRWLQADIDRGTMALSLPRQGKDGSYVEPLNVTLSIRDALYYAAAPTMQFVYLAPGSMDPLFINVTIDLSHMDPAGATGSGELGASGASLWFGHVSPDRHHAEIIAELESDLAKYFPTRYSPMIMFVASGAQPLRAALSYGVPHIALKRLALNAVFLNAQDALKEMKPVLAKAEDRISSHAQRALQLLGTGSILDPLGVDWRAAARGEIVKLAQLAPQTSTTENAERADIRQKFLDLCQPIAGSASGDAAMPTNDFTEWTDLCKRAIGVAQFPAFEYLAARPELLTTYGALVLSQSAPSA
ncbi:MAG: hypothetical protein K2X32_02010 [Phycisphaerales bacterium]|nr:hypothetical protein [Phycisphaerales bacterium]